MTNAVIKIQPKVPAVVLAPMDGLTDAPMRAVCGGLGGFTFAVSEFFRISSDVPATRVFIRHVPELHTGGVTPTGLPVQLQLLGGHAGRMAEAAANGVEAGAMAIDINFGCPAPTVNRHDGGATLLKHPERIREIVAAVRAALPPEIPVSAKLRLGWDSLDSIFENAEMAAEGGASWITIHGRTRLQGYSPPAFWYPIGIVRERLGIPVVANGDIWSLDEFRRCREETGCDHFMLGRGALANPRLAAQVARELGLVGQHPLAKTDPGAPYDWISGLQSLADYTAALHGHAPRLVLGRLKQWLSLASRFGDFHAFDLVKRAESVDSLFDIIRTSELPGLAVGPIDIISNCDSLKIPDFSLIR